MNTDMGCAKEQTIRKLVVECQKGQAEIMLNLESCFERPPKENVKVEGRPPRPNVLDEIADNLREISESQKRAVRFIAENINSKL